MCEISFKIILFRFNEYVTLAQLNELSTKPFTTITSTSVITGGSVTSDGGSSILARGVCWGENIDPTILDSYTSDGKGGGSFFSIIMGLTSGTGYYMGLCNKY
jgi:hypothetical protein